MEAFRRIVASRENYSREGNCTVDRPPPGLQNPDQPIVLDTGALKLTESAISVDQRGVPVRPSPPRSAARSSRLDVHSRRGASHAGRHVRLSRAHSEASRVAADAAEGARKGSSKPLPLAPSDLNSVHQEFLRSILPYSQRQRSSRLHGLGARRRNRHRNAGGDAGRRLEREPRRAGSRAHRSRAPDRSLDARAVRLSGNGLRAVCHRNLDGELNFRRWWLATGR